jgi:hypothetical protein
MIVAGAVLDAVARWPAHQIHQRMRAAVVALLVVAVGALADAVLDPVVSSTSSTSNGGPVLLP